MGWRFKRVASVLLTVEYLMRGGVFRLTPLGPKTTVPFTCVSFFECISPTPHLCKVIDEMVLFK